MAKEVLITGASGGFGQDASLLFKSNGWHVSAARQERSLVHANRIDREIQQFEVSP